MRGEGITGAATMSELVHRAVEVMRRESPCPAMDVCERYKEA